MLRFDVDPNDDYGDSYVSYSSDIGRLPADLIDFYEPTRSRIQRDGYFDYNKFDAEEREWRHLSAEASRRKRYNREI